MANLSLRSMQSEWMDGEDVAADDFAACLADLAQVNTLTLARTPTLAWLTRATRDLPRGGSFSLIDVGFGAGDMLRSVQTWAQRRGLRPRLIGYDLNPRSAPIAQAWTEPQAPIVYRTGDACQVREPVDFVISSLTTHHMSQAELVRFLAWMEGVTRRGWFINDLHRHALAYHGFRLLAWAARWHRFVRHDGPISVARSFRRADWLALLEAAGVDPALAAIDWRFPFRLCVGRLR